jgi:hypothetical protein
MHVYQIIFLIANMFSTVFGTGNWAGPLLNANAVSLTKITKVEERLLINELFPKTMRVHHGKLPQERYSLLSYVM